MADAKKTVEKSPDPTRLHRCQNCEGLFKEEDIIPLENVKNLFQRIAPGEEVPSGECKICGFLTHMVNPLSGQRVTIEAAIGSLDLTIKLLTSKADQILAEMKKKNHLEAKRLDFNRMREMSDAMRTIATWGKEGVIPQELIQGLLDKFGAIREQRKKGKTADPSIAPP